MALNKTTWQLNPFLRNKWGADRAVDGQYSDLSSEGGQCTVSAYGKSTAEWRVDIEGVFNIQYIFVQYRTNNMVWGMT